MKNAQTQTHPKGYLTLSISKSLERVSYYGVRALMVLYLMGEVMDMSRKEALTFYGWFSMLILFMGVIGALIGDLGIGNRKAIIFGAILQSVGAFTLCIPNAYAFYIGFSIFFLGNGLFVPNFNSNFGKQYLDRTKLLDSGFMILFIAINMGALLGPLVLGYVGEINFNYGFFGAGFFILLSLGVFLLAKPNLDQTQKEGEGFYSINYKIILLTLICTGAFWGLYEISNFAIIDIRQKISAVLGINRQSLSMVTSSVVMLPFSIIAAIYWTRRYSSQFTKLALGFTFTAISLVLLYLIPETVSEVHFLVFITSMVFLGLAEIFIGPVLLSVLTQYSNPKYLAIVMSLAFIPSRVFIALFGIFNTEFLESPRLALTVATIGIVCIGLILVVFSKKLSTVSVNEALE